MKISELPKEVREKALEYQKNETDDIFYKDSDILSLAFDWHNKKEGSAYWSNWHEKEPEKASHYDNSKGSIYKFCEDQKLNSYEFEIIKRIVRCRKKGIVFFNKIK